MEAQGKQAAKENERIPWICVVQWTMVGGDDDE